MQKPDTSEEGGAQSCCTAPSCCSGSSASCAAGKPIPLPPWARTTLSLVILSAAVALTARGVLSEGRGCAPSGALFTPVLTPPTEAISELEQALAGTSALLILLPSVCLLGAACSVASCCNLAIMGALASYAAAGRTHSRRDAAIAALCLTLGIVFVLSLVGVAIATPGRLLVTRFGLYGRMLTGALLVLFGLFAWSLLPVGKLAAVNCGKLQTYGGTLGPVLFGLVLGAASMSCSLTCVSPALPVALGVAALLPRGLVSVAAMIAFALGYSVPLTAVLLGVSYGKWTLCRSRFVPWVRRTAGLVMIALGFYFLAQ